MNRKIITIGLGIFLLISFSATSAIGINIGRKEMANDPPMTPSKPDGPDKWFRNVECTFSTSTTDPNGDQIYYKWDFGDGTITEWLGPYDSGENATANHTWTDLGEYEIKVIAKDEYDLESDWSEPLVISIIVNPPPNKPTITGETNGKVGEEYDYTFNATDPDEHGVKYFIDWGDGNTKWTSYSESGEEVTVKHTWNEKGNYTIRAKAQDIYGAEGPWGFLKVTMPKNKVSANTVFLQLLERLMGRFPLLE